MGCTVGRTDTFSFPSTFTHHLFKSPLANIPPTDVVSNLRPWIFDPIIASFNAPFPTHTETFVTSRFSICQEQRSHNDKVSDVRALVSKDHLLHTLLVRQGSTKKIMIREVDGQRNTPASPAACSAYNNEKRFLTGASAGDGSLLRSMSERPLFLTSSSFSQKAYGKCLANYKKRLELSDDANPAHGDLSFLVNVTMSPWLTDSPFLEQLAASFRKIADEEVDNVIYRNTENADIHGFVMQGLDQIHLVHIPMFNMAAHRWQLVITAEFPADVQKLYQKLRKENPDKFYTTANVSVAKLDEILQPGADLEYHMDEGILAEGADPVATFKLTNIRIVVKQSMSHNALDSTYPDRMPFYLYGSNVEAHIDHVLKTSPNAQLSGDCVHLNLEPALGDERLADGVVAVFEDVFEKAIQPLPQKVNLEDVLVVDTDAPGFSLVPGFKHKVSVYSSYGDFLDGSAQPIATGDIALSSQIFADWGMVNMDPVSERHDHKMS